MYNLELGTQGISFYVIVENNKIYFDSKEVAMEFIIELLKNTGRIGY